MKTINTTNVTRSTSTVIVHDGSDIDLMVDAKHIRVVNLGGEDNVQRVVRCQASDFYGDEFTKKFVIVDNAKSAPIDDREFAAAMRVEKAHGLIDTCSIAGHSGSMNKDGKYYAIPELDSHAEFSDWALCGLRFSKISKPLNKLLTYMGLVFSFAKPLADNIGIELDIRDACVLPDKYCDIKIRVDAVNNDESVELNKEYTDHRKFTDGKIRHRIPNVGTFQCRFAAILKGLAVYDAAPSLWHGVVEDIWGNPVDLSTKKIVIFESAFKIGAPKKNAINEGGWFDSFEQFANAAIERGHRFYACRVYNRKPRIAMSCYQDMQSVAFNDKEIDYFVKISKDYMAQFTDVNNAWKLLPANIGCAVKRDPAMFNIPEIAEMAYNGYKTKRLAFMNGRIPGIGAYIPVTVDERNVLHGDECYCSDIADDVDVIDLARKPLIGPDGHRVMRVCHYYPNASKHTLFVAKDSHFWQAGNADIDGDTPEVIFDSTFADAVLRTQNGLCSNPVLFPEGDGATPEKIGRRSIQEYMAAKARHDDGSDKIGVSVNAATNMLARGQYDRREMAILTYRANDGVNALSKHAATATKSTEKHVEKQYPWFRQFGSNPAPADKCTIYEGVVNRYAMLCRDNIPENLEFDNLSDEAYDPFKIVRGEENFMSKWRNVNTAAWAKIFVGDGTMKNRGLFYELAFANAEEYRKMQKNGTLVPDWSIDRGSQMREVMAHRVIEINRDTLADITLFDVMMVIWRTINARKSDKAKSVALRAFFTAFEKEFCILLDRYNEDRAINDLDTLCEEINADLASFDIGDDAIVEDESASVID